MRIIQRLSPRHQPYACIQKVRDIPALDVSGYSFSLDGKEKLFDEERLAEETD